MLENPAKKSAQTAVCLLSAQKRVRVEAEGILPDYSDDIHRLLRADARVSIAQKRVYLREDTLVCEVSGSLFFNVVYRGEEAGEVLGLCCHSFAQNFEEQFEIPGVSEVPEPCHFTCRTTVENTAARALTKKKCTASASLCLDAELWANKKVEYYEATDDCVECLKESIECSRLVFSREETFELEQEITLPEKMPSILNLVDCGVSLGTQRVRAGQEGVEAFVAATLCCAYQSEDDQEAGRLCSFSQPIEITEHLSLPDGEGEGVMDLFLTLRSLKAEVLMDAYGARRILRVNLSYNAQLGIVQQQKLAVVKDAYCTTSDSVPLCSTETFLQFFSPERIQLSETLLLETADSFASLEACSAELLVLSSEVDETGQWHGTGELLCRALGVREEDGRILNLQENVKLPLQATLGSLQEAAAGGASIRELCCSVYMTPVEKGVQVHLTASLVLLPFVKRTEEFLLDLEVQEQPSETFVGVRFYYPSPQESLWEIAKEHRVKQEALLSQNGIRQDASLPQMLMIVK